MIAWMVYSMVVSTLVLAAAFAAEQVLRLSGKPTRWVWLAALVVSLMVPAILPLLPKTPTEQPGFAAIPSSFAIQLDAVQSGAAQSGWSVPRILGAGWLGISLALVLAGGFASLRLRSARRRWRRAEVTGASVFISSGTGPAVVGFLQPEIVVPDWVCELPESDQWMIMAHEREHIRARDPLLMIFSRVVPALLPWNAAIWLQARRLRECVELDCDARLLAGGPDPNRYAELLLNVGGRAVSAPMFVAALTEPRSLLERRIRRMLEPQPRKRWRRMTSWSVAALAALLCAFRAPLPGEPVTIAEIIDRPTLVVQPETELPQDTSAPRLLNPAEVEEAAGKFYPPLIKDAGISGTPMVWVFVDTDGTVRSKRLSQGSAHKALDEAALRVVDVMRFAPAQFRGRAVTKWIEVAVEFSTDRSTTQAKPQPKPGEKVESKFGDVPVQWQTPPALTNKEQVARAMQRFYPPLLRDAGIGGTATIWLLIDETGAVTKTQLKKGSGHVALDEAALKVAEIVEFEAPRLGNEPKNLWIELPVTFDLSGRVDLGEVRDAAAAKIQVGNPTDAQIQEKLRALAETRRNAMDPQTVTDVTTRPVFTPYTVAPRMMNTAEVVRMMQRAYPPELRDAGIGGKVLVWFLIDEYGNVLKTDLKQSSGNLELDKAALTVAQTTRFTPALNRDQPVKVWIELPLEFKTREPEPPAALLMGTITDASARPVSGAQVAIVENSRGSLTNQAGRFALRTSPGTYSVRVSAPGFSAITRQVVVGEGTTRLDLQLAN